VLQVLLVPKATLEPVALKVPKVPVALPVHKAREVPTLI